MDTLSSNNTGLLIKMGAKVTPTECLLCSSTAGGHASIISFNPHNSQSAAGGTVVIPMLLMEKQAPRG